MTFTNALDDPTKALLESIRDWQSGVLGSSTAIDHYSCSVMWSSQSGGFYLSHFIESASKDGVKSIFGGHANTAKEAVLVGILTLQGQLRNSTQFHRGNGQDMGWTIRVSRFAASYGEVLGLLSLIDPYLKENGY